MGLGLKRLSSLDRAIVGGAAVVFVTGFLPWWGYQGPLAIYGGSISGWSAGFSAWAGILLLTLAGAYLALPRSDVKLPSIRGVRQSLPLSGAAPRGLLLLLLRS